MTPYPGIRSTRWLERLKRPWLFADADKCLMVALLVATVTASYTYAEYRYVLYPEAAPYINQDFVRKLIPWHVGLVLAWLGVALLSLLLRRRPALGWVPVYALTQLYAVGFSLTSYCYGHFTTNYMPSVLFAGLSIGFLLFDRRAILWALGVMLLIVGGTAVAEQYGLIPSAPLLSSSPIIDGRLSPSWLASLVVLILFTQILATGIVFYYFDRMRRWELELTQARDLIGQYVPRQVAEAIVSGEGSLVARHERRKLTIFFSDLVGFTEIAEEMEPEDLSRILNEYFSEMTEIAHRHGGTVDELAGDAILIFFGAPQATDDRDHALRAVRMALDMQAATAALNEKWRRAGIAEQFRVRMGLNTGVITIGNFGSAGRMKYAALGRHVNLAARLQAYCEPGQILITYATWLLVQDEIPCSPRGEIQLKGIHRPVMIYAVDAGRPGAHAPPPVLLEPVSDAAP